MISSRQGFRQYGQNDRTPPSLNRRLLLCFPTPAPQVNGLDPAMFHPRCPLAGNSTQIVGKVSDFLISNHPTKDRPEKVRWSNPSGTERRDPWHATESCGARERFVGTFRNRLASGNVEGGSASMAKKKSEPLKIRNDMILTYFDQCKYLHSHSVAR